MQEIWIKPKPSKKAHVYTPDEWRAQVSQRKFIGDQLKLVGNFALLATEPKYDVDVVIPNYTLEQQHGHAVHSLVGRVRAKVHEEREKSRVIRRGVMTRAQASAIHRAGQTWAKFRPSFDVTVETSLSHQDQGLRQHYNTTEDRYGRRRRSETGHGTLTVSKAWSYQIDVQHKFFILRQKHVGTFPADPMEVYQIVRITVTTGTNFSTDTCYIAVNEGNMWETAPTMREARDKLRRRMGREVMKALT